MDRWLDVLAVDKPIIASSNNLAAYIKSNPLLIIVCCIAVILHVRPIFFPMLIIGDENIHLVNGLWIYQYIDSSWHSVVRIIFWLTVCLLILIRIKWDSISNVFEQLCNNSSSSTKGNWNILFIVIAVLLAGHFVLFKDMAYLPATIRYPPVSKLLYFLAYSAFGIDPIFPRIVQLTFCLFSGIYLYRTIHLFYEKEAALLGASIYLFLPVSFAYAHLGELASGTIFFIIVIAFYFLRFLKYSDNRDLLLTVYLIGVGFLYKKPILLMFLVCALFLIVYKIKEHNAHSLTHIKVFSLALVPIVPWMFLTKYFSWRNYTFQSSNFSSLDGKFYQYILFVQTNMPWIVFSLFLLSVIYVCFFKRNLLTLFFSMVLAVYYVIIASDIGALSPRFSMPFYPSIIIFVSVFSAHLIQNIKWGHAFKVCSVVLIAYLIIICSVPSLTNKYLHVMDRKLLYYPSEEAMKWVKENVEHGEKIFILRILSSEFYAFKYNIDRKRIVELRYSIKDVDTPEKIIAYYKKHGFTYMMFPGRTDYFRSVSYAWILDYLRDDPNDEFEEIAEFDHDDNFIYIYKLKNI